MAEYLATYTDKPIGFAIGLPTVKKIVEEKFYTDLSGGALEAVGRLFKRSVKAYVYPGAIQSPAESKQLTIWL